jgi:phenylalanyl-tRNA synthetase beta chain
MRVPLSWLREYCDPGLGADAIAERLAMTGTEVARVERFGVGSPDRFVVGRVLNAAPHPDADRLRVCEVDDGSGSPRTIVCGAPNVAEGQTVAVALPGALMPDGSTLDEAELRGVVSHGMILSEEELGLGEDHAGIMILPDDLAPGAPLADHLTIAEEVLELEITPNRPDCLGVYGIARELSAATEAPLADDPTLLDAVPSGEDGADDHTSVEIMEPEVCQRFTARVFEDVDVGTSPPWLRSRLVAAGQRPISNVVDITNYVMLLTGQPLHAFDLEKVHGNRLVVRTARRGERMVTLDGVEREFDSQMALVCDEEGPCGIAGIMGGAASEVSEETKRVVMEVATWVGPNILRTSSKLGIRSEASTRFEKQLHPDETLPAQRLAARLMVQFCGARFVAGTLDAYPKPAQPRELKLRVAALESLLGEEIAPRDAAAILKRLGFDVERKRTTLAVTVPPWRDADVQREADLVEEVARIYGLEQLPVTLPSRELAVGRLTSAQRLRRRLEDVLRDRGLHEIVAWSFTSPGAIESLRIPDPPLLRLTNPLSEDQSVMRPLLLSGLLDAAQHNAAHGRPGVALFESARVYAASGPLELPGDRPQGSTPARERHHIAALATELAPRGWRSKRVKPTFYAAKALVEAMLAPLGIDWEAQSDLRAAVELQPGDRLDSGSGPFAWPFLHPGRSATVVSGAQPLGWIGELHPLVARAWDLERTVAFELDTDTLHELLPDVAGYREVAPFPALIQDIAVVVGEEVGAAEVEDAVREGAGELLGGLRIFDLYRGEQVGEGRKSLALRLEFQAPDRTLTDDDAARLRERIKRELEQIGGRLRA